MTSITKLTVRRKALLKREAECMGFRAGFSEDNRFAWIVLNEKGDCRFMKAAEEYDNWKWYRTCFIDMVEKARNELRK